MIMTELCLSPPSVKGRRNNIFFFDTIGADTVNSADVFTRNTNKSA
jgi:hypothetical protein